MSENYAICSFPPDATGECKKSENFKCIKVEGNFDLDAVGILASIVGPLAQNRISLYVISTYDTDYVLIHAKNIDRAVSCLDNFGHTFVNLEDKA